MWTGAKLAPRTIAVPAQEAVSLFRVSALLKPFVELIPTSDSLPVLLAIAVGVVKSEEKRLGLAAASALATVCLDERDAQRGNLSRHFLPATLPAAFDLPAVPCWVRVGVCLAVALASEGDNSHATMLAHSCLCLVVVFMD